MWKIFYVFFRPQETEKAARTPQPSRCGVTRGMPHLLTTRTDAYSAGVLAKLATLSLCANCSRWIPEIQRCPTRSNRVRGYRVRYTQIFCHSFVVPRPPIYASSRSAPSSTRWVLVSHVPARDICKNRRLECVQVASAHYESTAHNCHSLRSFCAEVDSSGEVLSYSGRHVLLKTRLMQALHVLFFGCIIVRCPSKTHTFDMMVSQHYSIAWSAFLV